MERSKINPAWPNALRWFLIQGVHRLRPWHFIEEPDQMIGPAQAFEREDTGRRKVFVFAWRGDCDDYAGLEIIDGIATDKVIAFHPSFGTNVPGWDIVDETYVDVFEFVARRVVPDMKDWALVEDAGDL